MSIVSVTIPFFALVLIGYVAARVGILPLAAVPGLNSFVLYFALTALLFRLGAQTPVRELLDPVLLGVWTVAGLLVLAAGVLVGLRRRAGWLDAAFGGLIAVLPNSGFMGLPLITALLGVAAAGPIITSLLVDVVLMQSIAVALSQREVARDGGLLLQVRASLLRVVRNPMPWAIVLGAGWGMTGMPLPGPLDTILAMLADSATPVALFTIGAVLAREQMRQAEEVPRRDGAGDVRRDGAGIVRRGGAGDVAVLAGIKLLVHPVAVWVLGRLVMAAGLPLDDVELLALVLAAALPSATNVSVLGERMGADNGRLARVIMVSTTLGFATFTAAVAALT